MKLFVDSKFLVVELIVLVVEVEFLVVKVIFRYWIDVFLDLIHFVHWKYFHCLFYYLMKSFEFHQFQYRYNWNHNLNLKFLLNLHNLN